jgi:penicillin V acylase-like amidase (Ntn superfamily)
VREGYMNIAQNEVITWVLGYNKNIDDLIENLSHMKHSL